MTNLKRTIVDKVVKPYNSSSFGTVKAKVVNFDNIRNRVDVEFQQPNSVGTMFLEKVPVAIGSTGVKSAGIVEGEYVWLTFINNSPLLPKVVGIADERYEVNTREKLRHIRQGVLMPNVGEVEEVEIEPLSSTLIDNGNEKYSKHSQYFTHRVEDRVTEFRKHVGYYGSNEVGITHHLNNSTIKVNDDGTIDVFTETNHGIKINPATNEISINSNKDLKIKSTNIVIESNNISIESSDELNITAPTINVKGVLNKL